MTHPLVDRLLAKIKSHHAVVGIIGMGYVGLSARLVLSFSGAYDGLGQDGEVP